MKTVFWWALGVTVWSAAHFLVYLKLFYTSVGGGAGQPSEALQLLSLGFGLLTGVVAIVLAGLARAKRSPRSPWPRRLVRGSWTASFAFLLGTIVFLWALA